MGLSQSTPYVTGCVCKQYVQSSSARGNSRMLKKIKQNDSYSSRYFPVSIVVKPYHAMDLTDYLSVPRCNVTTKARAYAPLFTARNARGHCMTSTSTVHHSLSSTYNVELFGSHAQFRTTPNTFQLN